MMELGRSVVVPASGTLVPASCACCGAVASESRLERAGPNAASLIIPYCVRCLRHASARTTRNLAAAIASCLVAFTFALALPLAWPHAGLVVHTLLVIAPALIPIGWRVVFPRRPLPGHSAVERAAFWLSEREIGFTNTRFAAELAKLNGVEARAALMQERRLAPWLVAGPVVALLIAPASWLLHHPLVRIINLSEARISLLVDGRPVADVEPTSAESPAAGVEIRLPTGDRELTALAPDGKVVATARARLESGARHLYAPASEGTCFWLEETRYGRAAQGVSEVVALTGQSRFWVLPRHVDSWFAPNPPALTADTRSSGGVLVALRQAPCAQAPTAAH